MNLIEKEMIEQIRIDVLIQIMAEEIFPVHLHKEAA